jgi:PAS domain S-box-containing protein
MIHLSGYQIFEEIGESQKTTAYKGFSEKDGNNVIIKTARETKLFLPEFKREYELSRQCNIDGIVKIYRFESYEGGTALIMEDFGGVSLKKIVLERKANLQTLLKIAVRTTDILGVLHEHKFIHGDIKPSNIIVNIQTGEVKITDFGYVHIPSAEESSLPDFSAVTPAYMSPEQTGRMNRTPDFRTDFYSLGVSLYEMLTGELPFKTSDPIAMSYCHIAREPKSLHDAKPEICPVISDIVMKLIRKNPEDRYQSAYGVRYDLQKCLTLLEENGRIPDFPIGGHDVSPRLNIPQKVYGREAEKKVLWEAFGRVMNGGSEILMIHGHAGVGKMRIVHEAYLSIVHTGAFLIEGKYDPLKRDIPYSGIIQAVQGLIRKILTESGEELLAWKEKLLRVLSVNGRMISDVIPEVEMIVGPLPETAAMNSIEQRNVFDMTFQEFFKVLASREHPLIMILANLQDADSASLKMIENILTASQGYFLFVGSYREEQLTPEHLILQMLERIGNAKVPVAKLKIGSYGVQEINDLVSGMLSCDKEISMPLSRLILEKTGGNPFFVDEFIKRIHREHLLRFDAATGHWTWELAQIGKLGVTDNVIDLLADRLNSLPDIMRNTLSLAACLGEVFEAGMLARLSNDPSEEVFHAAIASVNEGLLIHLREAAMPSGEQKGGEADYFRFSHSRIQEAAYKLLPRDEISFLHLKIGRALLEKTRPETLDDRIFEIVSHLLKGAYFISAEKDKLELAKLSLMAGGKAKSSAAYDQACAYLAEGTALLTENIWTTDYVFAFSIYKEQFECEYLAGNHEQAQRLFDLTLKKAISNLEKAEIYRIRMALDANMGKFVEHNALCIEALKLFGVHLPDLTDQQAQQKAIADELEKIRVLLGDRKIADLIDLPTIADPGKKACQKLLRDALSSAYVSDTTFFALSTLTLVDITLTSGVSRDSAYAFAAWGLLLSVKFQDYETAFELGSLSLKLNERLHSKINRSAILFVIGNFINHWRKHLRLNMAYLREAFKAGIESGDFVYGSFSAMSIARVSLSWGHEPLESILADIQEGLSFFKRIKNDPAYERQELNRHVVLNLLGLTENRDSFNSDVFNEACYLQKMQSIQYRTGIAIFYLYKAQTLYLCENYREALKMAEEAVKNIPFIASMMQESDCILYHSLIMASLYPGASGLDKQRYEEALKNNQARAKNWLDNCPENFLCRFLLVEAEIARITGNFSEASRLFDEAIRSAEDNGFIFLAALASELAAKCCLARGILKGAGHYLGDALFFYQKWGALGKVNALKEKYGPVILFRPPDRSKETAEKKIKPDFVTAGGVAPRLADMIDLTSIIKASQIMSGEIFFNRLIDKLMKILIENAGAQTGFLVIDDDDEKIFIAAQGGGNEGILVTAWRSRVEHAMRKYPQEVINYVRRTEQKLVLNDATSEGLFAADPYIIMYRPKSIICIPVTQQAKTVGILYLENRTLKNAFTPERIEVLEILSSQAAISIKNSMNYEEINRTKNALQESKEKLQQSLEEYRNLFENIQDVFYRTDLEGMVILMSPSVEKLLGYRIDELQNSKFVELYRDPEEERHFLNYLSEKEYVENYETQLRKKNGDMIWVSANAHYYRDKERNILGVEGMLRDITARKQADKMLLDEKERLSVTLRSIGDGVIAADIEGKVVLMNRVAEELTGWMQKEACGRNLENIFPIIYENNRLRCENPMTLIQQSGIRELTDKILLVGRDKTERLIGASVAPIRDNESMIIGAIIVFRDITEKRRMEAEILKHQKLETIGLFAGGIAHDFNNILTGILGSVSLAKMYVKQEEKVLEKLNEAEKASIRAKGLTQQLLTFSKGGSPIRKTASIACLLKESVRFVLSGSNVKSEFDIAEDLWPADVDEGQINQVINNLVINALQAMPAGGTLSIDAGNIHLPADSRVPLPQGSYIRIAVKDDGIGISEECLPKIFDPFFSTKPKGNGLGLATTYSIIRKHDGYIDCESQKGLGSVFHIYLPVSKKQIITEQQAMTSEANGCKGRVILMDDEEMIRDVGTEMLEFLGYEAVQARDGMEAVELYASAKLAGSPFQAVIMDLTIPGGMGGKEAIEKLKEIDPDVKAIVSSGYSNDPVMANFEKYGFAGMMIKPYRIDDLKKVMQRITD